MVRVFGCSNLLSRNSRSSEICRIREFYRLCEPRAEHSGRIKAVS